MVTNFGSDIWQWNHGINGIPHQSRISQYLHLGECCQVVPEIEELKLLQ